MFKRIKDLSGGERGRVSLAKLMLSNANFLILDEPTNHLDITSKEILEHALNQYTGTVLYVSHDRYFINKTATRIVELTGETFINYIGNYDYYLERKRTDEPALRSTCCCGYSRHNLLSLTQSRTGKRKKRSRQSLRKRQNQLKKTEEEITSLEERDRQLDELLSDPKISSNVAKLMELHKEKEAIASRLEELYELWENLAE